MAGTHSRKGATTSAGALRTKTSRASQQTPVATRSGKSSSPAGRHARTVEGKPNAGAATITAQTIAEAAYFLWLERGGDELSNWLEAEAMLKARSVETRSPV